MNKKPEFAGSFYPNEANELTNLINSFKLNKSVKYKSKAIIVPHAGYIYSGYSAMAAYQHFDLSQNIFIIAPSHHKDFENIALPEYKYFDTPLGSLEVNTSLIKNISEKFPSVISNEPFEQEHSIEVQLPFIQNLFMPQIISAVDFVNEIKKIGRKIKIIPILIGNCNYKLISDIIATYWETSSFIISTDLSHFYTQKECQQIDSYTATIIETGKLEFFQRQQACGLTGIMGLVDFANNNNSSLIRTMIYNSGDISKETERVVGYGSWLLYPDTKNDFIEKFYSKYILETVNATILGELNNATYVPQNIPTVLTQHGASFVTLKLQGQLRGCIGSVYPTKPLIIDLIDNAKNAAFNDFRFNPLTIEELKNIEISVSLLSSIERINFKDERDLLSKIYPYGIILAEGSNRAVYLPIVWEQLPDRQVFLKSLKEKAGFHPEYFSKKIEAYKFNATYIEE